MKRIEGLRRATVTIEFNLCGDQSDEHLKEVAQILYAKAASFGNELVAWVEAEPIPEPKPGMSFYRKDASTFGQWETS